MRLKIIFTLALLASMAVGIQAQTKYAGGDLSMLPKYEEAGVAYYDNNGTRITGDMLEFFRDKAGFNIVRVRLFVNPTGASGVCQDLDYVKSLGKRIKDAGMAFLLDFHYSDTWADPAAQWTPSAWTSLSDNELYTKIYTYTKESLEALVAYGATPDFIQTGNEISYGMLWGANGTTGNRCYTSSDANWERFRTLLTRAGAACREVCPNAKIIIHTERTGVWSTMKGIYDRLGTLDYDIIGLSYYPEWHNSIATLTTNLTNLHNTYPSKDVMIVETGYFNNYYNTKAEYDFQSTWPASANGQKAFIDDLVAATKNLDYVKALLYWFPEENQSAGNSVYTPWYNHGLFSTANGYAVDALYAIQGFIGKSTDTDKEAKQIYAMGNGDFGGWDTPSTPKALTAKGDGENYYIDVVLTDAQTWFCFSDGGDADWTTFNNTLRLSTGTKNHVLAVGNTYQLSKAGDCSMVLPAGSYRLTVNSKTLMLTVEDLAAGLSAIQGNSKQQERIYNLQGIDMTGRQLPHGIYIQNNKKLIK